MRELQEMLFQNYALFPHMTIAENIAYPLKLRKSLPKKEIAERVDEMIEDGKAQGNGKAFPKAALGRTAAESSACRRAIVYNPPILLLDEPLGALDMNLRHEMQFEIKRITRELGMTTISVTHDQEEAFAMSDKICIMNKGMIQQFDTPENIYENPANKFVAEFMGTTNIINIHDITYTMRGNRCVVTGMTDISDRPVTVLSLTLIKWIRLKHKAMLTLRPEYIRLDREGGANIFDAKVSEHVYVGECVKIKAEAKNKLLNVRMGVDEFRSLMGDTDVSFAFDKDAVSIIYS